MIKSEQIIVNITIPTPPNYEFNFEIVEFVLFNLIFWLDIYVVNVSNTHE